MKHFVGQYFHHKIRKFSRLKDPHDGSNIISSFREDDGFIDMKISDFIDYLETRSNLNEESDPQFLTLSQLKDSESPKAKIDIFNTGLYMVDFDLVKLLPPWYDDLLKKFKLTDLLPGGDHCMMNSVSKMN